MSGIVRGISLLHWFLLPLLVSDVKDKDSRWSRFSLQKIDVLVMTQHWLLPKFTLGQTSMIIHRSRTPKKKVVNQNKAEVKIKIIVSEI